VFLVLLVWFKKDLTKPHRHFKVLATKLRFMKKFYRIVLPAFFIFVTQLSGAQDVADSTGLPGDNFSLEGALEMFKKASSPEEFEKLINTENNGVNNLDLDNDGNIDYVKVIDKKEGDVHAFVLQDPVSETESQDIAVIELEKKGKDNAVLQIIGDEDIYGEETIVEPADDATGFLHAASFMSPDEYSGDYNYDAGGIVVNVWMWPAVRFVYAPAYVVWVSPWRWRAYPAWWHPWRPVRLHVFYPRRVAYVSHYTIVATHRIIRAHRIYRPVRVTSVSVRTRNNVTLSRYRTTKRTTVIQGPRRKYKLTRSKTVRRGRY